MTQAEIYQAVSPKLPKNFPFYDWVPKPLGIAFLVIVHICLNTLGSSGDGAGDAVAGTVSADGY